jgi:hypothetical protein
VTTEQDEASDADLLKSRHHEDLSRALGRVEGKIDMLIASNTATVLQCKSCESRFSKLETDNARIKVVAYVATFVATFLGAERLGKLFHLPF